MGAFRVCGKQWDETLVKVFSDGANLVITQEIIFLRATENLPD